MNIAIGQHNLECIEHGERKIIQANFDDADIDLYISGHVHAPSLNITVNTSDYPFIELTSGAAFSEEYAVPGFVDVDINLVNGDAPEGYHVSMTSHDYCS